MKNVVFCTTVKNRLAHISQTLPVNLRNNLHSKFVVLNYNSPDGLEAYLKDTFPAEIESGRLTVYSHYDSPVFQMAHAKNMAHRCGILEGADILVNLDADGYAGKDFDLFILENIGGGLLQAMWNRWATIDGKKEWVSQDVHGNYCPPVPKGSNGRMVVTTRGFLKAGGYDEKYATWGPDDKDFNIRLRRLGYDSKMIDIRFLETILHNDKVRFREYPEAVDTKSYEFKITIHDSEQVIANYGRVGMGKVFRNFNPEPIYLGPIPTRIFGIGMHKTGTTSLHHAFENLGFDSSHWPSAHWAKAVWREMNERGMSPTLEKSYAACDLPIPLLYKRLDKTYPGSKFILTTRSEESWLRSVERHWSPEFNQYREVWDRDPFTHRVHTILYGRQTFDKEVFLARFRRHNAEVMDYFRGRSDLLVMDKHDWNPLCEFLGLCVPNMDYPEIYKTND